MHVLDANEIFWMTFYTYDRIIEVWGKNWPDAFALYVKLIKQSRIQQTNQTKSLNTFLKTWLKRTDERLKKARDILKSLWLINDVIVRDEIGRIIWHYVRVNFLINENKVRTLGIDYNLSTTPEIQDVANTTCGKSDTNALSNTNINALSTQEQKWIEFEEFWKKYPNKKWKDVARKARCKMKQEEKELAYKSIELHQKYDINWNRENWQFIPHGSTYLNQKRREDEFDESKPIQNEIVIWATAPDWHTYTEKDKPGSWYYWDSQYKIYRRWSK